VLRQLRVLHEQDVVVGARRRHAVPHPLERDLLVVGVELDLEDAQLVRLADVRVGERVGASASCFRASRSRGVLRCMRSIPILAMAVSIPKITVRMDLA
jgi:hypothetical protein